MESEEIKTEEIVRATEFNETEVQEINNYVRTNVPYSVLETIFPLTEHVINKCTIFITVYRIVSSCSGYVSKPETKTKIDKLINQLKDTYTEVYDNLIVYNSMTLGSGDKFDRLVDVLKDTKKKELINNLIDIFLVFSERQKLFNLDKISGIRTDTTEGDQIVDELINTEG